jgi:hypothetical protein
MGMRMCMGKGMRPNKYLPHADQAGLINRHKPTCCSARVDSYSWAMLDHLLAFTMLAC